MIVKDIAICNPKNNYIPNSFINYIDTASALDGKIKNIQKTSPFCSSNSILTGL